MGLIGGDMAKFFIDPYLIISIEGQWRPLQTGEPQSNDRAVGAANASNLSAFSGTTPFRQSTG